MKRASGIGAVVVAAATMVVAHRESAAFEVRVAAWNVHEGFSVESVAARRDELRRFAERVRPDVLVLEEVTSHQVVAAVRDAMGLTGYYSACSDFNPADAPDFTALEVAVLSRFPITQAIEYDPSPDRIATKRSPEELPLVANPKLGVPAPADVTTIRGFLWVRIDDLRLTVVGVHLKSSRGEDGAADVGNAERREFVAAQVAESVAQDRRLYPEYSCVVAGDFNVGHSDPKNGLNLKRDDAAAAPGFDGYDETHALIGGGLAGVRMRNLMAHIDESTFPSFPSTPIDNIYVAGPNERSFVDAVAEADTYGSDHKPIWSKIELDGVAPKIVPAPPDNFEPDAVAPIVGPTGDGSVVAAADAARWLGKLCTVEFDVRSGTKLSERRIAFLNSAENFRDAKNFTAVIGEPALKEFAAAGIDDPSQHFRGKRVRVTGVVAVRNGAYQIVVDDPAQIAALPAK